MTDKIRAALAAYKEIANYMNDEVCPSYAGDCKLADEALWEYDARATPALPKGVEEWIAENGLQMEETLGGFGEQIMQSKLCKYPCPDYIREDDLRAYLSGMAIVPVEPTRAMCKAATSYTHSHDAKLIYKAMLAAAAAKEKQS